MKRLVLLALWLVATGAAVGVAWAGVSVVDRQVTRSEAVPPLGSEEIVASSTAVTTGSTTTPSDPTSPTSSTGSTATAGSTPTTTTATVGTTAGGPTPADATTETFTLIGGTAAISFSPDGVEVLWATPQPGFEVSIEPESTSIEVDFRSHEHRSRLEVWWSDGPRHSVQEEADDD